MPDTCDFCGSPFVRWSYPSADVSLWESSGMISTSSNGFAACEDCHCLVEVGDKPGLIRRGLRTMLQIDKRKEAGGYVSTDEIEAAGAMLTDVQRRFFEMRLGQARKVGGIS